MSELYVKNGSFEANCIGILVAYCGNIDLTLNIVNNDDVNFVENVFSRDCIASRIPTSMFNKVCFLQESDLKTNITSLVFPVLVEVSEIQDFKYCGLCTVLRMIIKKFYKDSLNLLGHRLFCLKACSEVSTRTKLCEVEIVNAYSDLMLNNTQIPKAIIKLETLLKEPVVMHNMDKKQRVLLKKMKETSGTSKTNKEQKIIVFTKDLPQLEHTFLEGVELHLSDIVVLPCVHRLMKIVDQVNFMKDIPATIKWYRRMCNISQIKSALKKCQEEVVEIPLLTGSIESNTEMIQLKTDSTNKDKLKKSTLDQTIRRDLPLIKIKLQTSGINPAYSLKDMITIHWNDLPEEVHPVRGELSYLRATRKCQQIENIYSSIKPIARVGCQIVDFCCGGGHVGIVLAYLLPHCSITIIDNKEESLDRARSRATALRLGNIRIIQSNLEYFRGSFDVGVSLHACGVATDMVLRRCVLNKAHFAISPCCYGRIQKTSLFRYPQSEYFEDIPLAFDEMVVVGHAADQTTWEFESEKAKQGKFCMGIIDMDRLKMAEENNYETTLYSMQPQTCTPKNNLIFGRYMHGKA